jgi:hypothetical protein
LNVSPKDLSPGQGRPSQVPFVTAERASAGENSLPGIPARATPAKEITAMAENIRIQVDHLLRLLFPPEAMIQAARHKGELVISVSWRLGPNRMDNWSKEIRLTVPPDAAERYGKLNEKGRARANGNLVSFVQLKLGKFDPHHDRPRYLLPPVEVWEMRFEDIFPSSPAKAEEMKR